MNLKLPFKKTNADEPALIIEKRTKRASLWKEYRALTLCMLLPAVIMYLIYVSKAHYPFGEGSVLVLDLNAQYVWFFEALRNFARGDASLLYSFCRSLGGEFLGIYAYYIASPLSYIVCLFPKERMLEGLLTLFLLKTAICGGTFGYYMKKSGKIKNDLSVIVFSIFYALSSYAVVQQHNTMWIDAVMWLPLITLGIEELIKHGKFKMYTIFLALTVFSNYYSGYMVCIYCLIYFFLYYLAHNEEFRNNPLREKLHFVKSLFRIAFFSMIAMGIAAVIILSAYYSLNFGKTTFSDPDWTFAMNFDIIDILYKFLPGSYDTVRPEGIPFVYCGLLTLLLLPAYFLSHSYPMRQKIVSGIFIFIFIASFSINLVDLVWHGFQFPNWLNHRYSFMICFYLCVLSCRAFAEFEKISLRAVMGTGGLIALFCVILQKYDTNPEIKPDDFTTVWFTLIMIFAYLSILGILRKTTDKQFISIFLVAAVAVEVFLSGLWNLNGLDDDVVFTRYTSYNGFLDDARPIVEKVQEADDSFYRMEKNFAERTNDNMALKIRGLSGSTSTLNEETIRFLNKMGYASQSHWSTYGGGTPVNDSLLGIKYVLSDDKIYQDYYETFITDRATGHIAYRNPYALSIAYGVNDEILNFPLGFKEKLSTDTTVTTEESSKMSEAVSDLKAKLNDWLDINETIRNAEYVDAYSSPFERMNAMLTAMLGEEETVQVFVPVPISKTDFYCTIYWPVSGHKGYQPDPRFTDEEEAYVSFTATMPVEGELFFYIPSDYPQEVGLSLLRDGEIDPESLGDFYGGDTSCILSLGKLNKDEKFQLRLMLEQTFYAKNGQDYFYYIDWDVYKDVMTRLGQDQYQITEYTEDSFLGTFTASREKELVLTSIPYDRGWKVYVDGEQVEIQKALGALVSFYIEGEAGQTHELKMVYRPNTFIIGTVASLTCIAFLVALIVLEKRMKRIPFLRAVISIPEPGAEALAEDPEAPSDAPLPEETDADDPEASPESASEIDQTDTDSQAEAEAEEEAQAPEA